MIQRRAFLSVLGLAVAAGCGAGTGASTPDGNRLTVTPSFVSAVLADNCGSGAAGALREGDCATDTAPQDAGSGGINNFAPPADAGGEARRPIPVPDGGASASDAGGAIAPPRDAGSTTDTGSGDIAPPRDGGAGVPLPADAGGSIDASVAPPRDAGNNEVPRPDSGSAEPPQDAGVAADTGPRLPCTGYCQQSTMQLLFRASGEGNPAVVEVVTVRLLDASTGAELDTLIARDPTAWNEGTDGYRAWDRTVAQGANVRASWLLSAPNWARIEASSADRIGGRGRYRLEVVLRIDGVSQTVRSGELSRAPEIAT